LARTQFEKDLLYANIILKLNKIKKLFFKKAYEKN